jgi:hypothetical protein
MKRFYIDPWRRVELCIIAVYLIGASIAGCHTAPVSVPTPSVPCKPSVTEEMHGGKHPAAIVAHDVQHSDSWNVTHEIRCGENEATVMPSVRMYKYASELSKGDDDKTWQWLYAHTYCVADGMPETK